MWKIIKRNALRRINFPLRQRPEVSSSTHQTFIYLAYLGDDLILEILSYISFGPMEMDTGKK